MRLRGLPRPVSTDPCATDAAALRRLAGGDVSALAEIYDRHAPALLRFSIRVVGARDAEDLVQATFMTAFKVASAYDGRGESARPWLYGILSKHIHERRRSLLRCARAILRLGGEAVRVPTTADRSDLSRGLELLSEAKRVVLLLAEVEGYSAHEIADLLGVPVGTVWTRLHHARRQLRVFYGDPEST